MARRSVLKACTSHRSSDNGYGQESDGVRNTKQGRKIRRESVIDTDYNDEDEDDSEHESDEDDDEDKSDGADDAYRPERPVSITAVCILLC
jgi:hypothetical protein